MIFRPKAKLYLLLLAWLVGGCTLMDDSGPQKASSMGLIATPASYYSTAKARYLGTKYKENLGRLTERIVRNAKTAPLQFANNISSVGGIGFFTHSATKTSDERYLEVVLGTPETFETKGEYSEKVNQLFTRYGPELLGILAGDSQIFQDKELRGYGLNFTWRTVVSESAANRVSLARAIIYFQKEKVASFLREGLDQNELLRDAVIFAVEDDGPLNLVSYQPKETKPDFRPAIREDNLALAPAAAKSARPPRPSATPREAEQKRETKTEAIKKDLPTTQAASARSAASTPISRTEGAELISPAGAKREVPPVSRAAEPVLGAVEKPGSKREDSAEKLALGHRTQAASQNPSPTEAKSEPVSVPTKTMPLPASDLTPLAGPSKLPQKPKVTESVAGAQPQPRSTEKLASDKNAELPRKEAAATATKPALGTKNQEVEAKAVKEAPKPLPAVAPSKASHEAANPKPLVEIKPPERVTAPAPTAKAPAPRRAAEEKGAAPTSAVATLENRQSEIAPVPAPVKTARRETEKTTDRGKSPVLPAPDVRTKEAARAPEKTPPGPAVAKVAKPEETKPLVMAAKQAAEVKPSATKDNAPAPVRAPVALPPVPRTALEPAAKATVAKTATEPAKSPEVDTPEMPVARPTPRQLPKAVPARESVPPSAAVGVKKSASPAPPVAAAVQEKAAEKPPAEQLALLKKPEPSIVDKRPLARPLPRSLEGFIIQIAFSDKEKAQNWAEKMEQRGYAVSVTETGGTGSLRVRLGNFAMRDDAERQLRNFKQEGMSGIIINLPQAFRPEARSSVP